MISFSSSMSFNTNQTFNIVNTISYEPTSLWALTMINKWKGETLFNKPHNSLRVKGSRYASLANILTCSVSPQAIVSVNVYQKLE